MKSLQEVMTHLADLERRLPVNDWTVDGVRVWPLFRCLLYSHLSISLRGSPVIPPVNASKLALLIDAFRAPFRDAEHRVPRTAPADAFILSYSAVRQARISGRHVDIRTGPLADLLGRRAHVWEYSLSVPYRFPRHNPTHPIQRSFFLTQLGQKLFPRRLHEVRLPQFPEEPLLRESAFLREVGLVLALRDTFDRALDVIRPLAAFTSNVGRYEFALNLACARRNIPVVEVQHGVFGPLHGHYSGWTRVPKEGYDLLPYAWWCWDASAAGPINQWSEACAPRHHAVDGGMPWLDYWASLDPGPTDASKKILVTLQPPEKIYADERPLPDFVLEAFSRADQSWTWWVRPHPTMAQHLPALEAEFRRRGLRADFDTARETPLPLLLRRADLHATHSSSTVVEAARFGVPSVVWSTLGTDYLAGGAEFDSALETGPLAEALVRRMNGGRKSPAPSSAPPVAETLERFLDLGRRLRAASKA